jgi:hypothetical protein
VAKRKKKKLTPEASKPRTASRFPTARAMSIVPIGDPIGGTMPLDPGPMSEDAGGDYRADP